MYDAIYHGSVRFVALLLTRASNNTQCTNFNSKVGCYLKRDAHTIIRYRRQDKRMKWKKKVEHIMGRAKRRKKNKTLLTAVQFLSYDSVTPPTA